ncbi:glycosyltransferase family 2 protein [Clostridium sp. AM58-1XD]|uniref:glycosyltransferase family 2 protein n=1 Tax=Clostridium sp. AM58-1XD TaxID=2292307 RepID=UPI000E4CDF00|nr:glycosyltransferase family 2 protein [Clostridium sp. AM58-1XD]RGY98933.1 glycosyltransferase family 2 protein [Clostridium sp. AM58-1XD]
MITVLVAVYNGEKYLKEQLDSILNQTCKEINIIVSDDVSSDGSRAIIRSYAEKMPERIVPVFRSEPSGSAENHFLWLLSQADDDYIMLSDQDDVWFPDKAECLLAKIREMETDYGRDMPILVHSDMEVVDEELHVTADSYFRYQKISPERNKLSQQLVQSNVTGGAVMINRRMLAYLKQVPEVCLMHDSWMALIAASFGKIGWVERPLYLYRQHGGNTLGARRADTLEEAGERLRDGSRARENYRRMFGQAQCLLDLYEDLLDETQKETLRAFIRLKDQGRFIKIRNMVKYGFTKNSLKRTIGQMMFM